MNKETKFPSLFGNDANGKQKVWNICAIDKNDHSVVEIQYGYVSGKITRSSKIVSQGKNIGKRNETTHYEQAISEATSKWKKKTETGFSELNNKDQNIKSSNNNEEDAKRTNDENPALVEKINQNDQSVTFPMLASDFQKFKKKVIYPVYIQPKLDGYRMLFNTKDKSCNSRQGKSFDAIKRTKLYNELEKIECNGLILDGELYRHGGIFEHLGILRKKHLNNDDYERLDRIEYHVYDFVDTNLTFNQRLQKLQDIFTLYNFQYIKLVTTYVVELETQINQKHLEFINEGYEGSMIRTSSGKYRCKCRSQDLLKFKDFQDSEYTIINFTSEQDTSSNQELIVWICKNDNGDTFNVRPKGTREERNYLWSRGKDFIGQKLHVKYFELTDSKIPRFPTTKSESYTTYIRNVVE